MKKTMKRTFEKGKKVVSALVLGTIIVCAVSPALQAKSPNCDGCRVDTMYGYRSFTEVSGYESNGVGLNLTAGAEIGSKGVTTKYGRGSVSVYSNYSGKKVNAHHAYGIGRDLDHNTWFIRN